MDIEQANQAQEAHAAGATTTAAKVAAGSLSHADIDGLVYRCRQAGDDSTYALASAIEQLLMSRAESPSGAQLMEAVTLLQLSAPRQIYLDIGEDLALATPQRFDLLEGVTWSEDNATSHGIPYVRADLAAATPSGESEQEADDGAATTLRSLLQEVSACYTRDDDLPNDLLPRIDTALNGTSSAG